MQEEVKAAFGKVWPAHVASLTRFPIECRRAFDGDLDMFLILAVIGDRTLSQRHADPNMTFDSFRAGRDSATRTLDINLLSNSEFSGIPRETARRKVAELTHKGRVARNGDGRLAATRKAATDLEPLTLTSIRYIAGMMELLKAALPAGNGLPVD